MKSFILVLSILFSSMLYAADQPKDTCGGSTCCEAKKADCCEANCTVKESDSSKPCCTKESACCKDTSCCEKNADGKMICSAHKHDTKPQ
jgi:hypothetical protein